MEAVDAVPVYEEIVASFTYKTFESENRSFCVFRYKNHETQKEFTAVGSMLPGSLTGKPAESSLKSHSARKYLLREKRKR